MTKVSSPFTIGENKVKQLAWSHADLLPQSLCPFYYICCLLCILALNIMLRTWEHEVRGLIRLIPVSFTTSLRLLHTQLVPGTCQWKCTLSTFCLTLSVQALSERGHVLPEAWAPYRVHTGGQVEPLTNSEKGIFFKKKRMLGRV